MEKDRKIMIIIKRLVTRLTLTALMIPAAYASIPDCADDQNGTISPVQNLVNGCYIYASEIEPSSMAKSVLKLWAADGVQLSSAQEVIDQLNRLAIYSPGYGVNNVTWVSNTDNFVNYNGLDHVINSGANSDGVAVLAVGQQSFESSYGIEDSAYTFQAALNFVNTYRTSASKIATLGHSLGGITIRYALADMEEKNIPHNVGLYVSNDAPDRGAYVPQSLQQILPVLESYKNDLSVLEPSISAFFTTWEVSISFSATLNTILSVPDALEGELEQASSMLRNKVGKQLLIDHVLGTAERTSFMTTLTTLGYPTQATNIAITSGSVEGVMQSVHDLNANGAYYEFFGKKGDNVDSAYFGAHFALYPTVAGQQNLYSKFSGWVQKKAPCPWPMGFLTCTSTNETSITPRTRTTPATAQELDAVPGSIVNIPDFDVDEGPDEILIGGTPGEMLGQVTNYFFVPVSDDPAINHFDSDYNFPFIPTFSALDIDRPINFSDSVILSLAAQTTETVSVNSEGKLLGIDAISGLHFDDIYVNGDNNLSGVNEAVTKPELIADNLSHLDVYWPAGVINAIKGTVDP